MVAPFVLLHPFPLDGTSWDAVATRLAGGRAVHVPEFPGFGRAPLERAPSIHGFADAVAARVRAQAPAGRAIVCGVSMGGYVALALAARHPDAVAGLVLSGTRADEDDADMKAARRRHARELDAGGVEEFLTWMLGRLAPSDERGAPAGAEAIARRQSGEAMAGAARAMAERPDRSGELAAMDVPAVVVWGDLDPAIPAEAARLLAGGLPRGRLHVVHDAGHLVPMERPDEFIAVAEALAAEVDAQG